MSQDIFAFRYWGWWLLVALLRLAHLFVWGLLIMTGDVRVDSLSLWLLPEGRLPELFDGFTGALVFLDTLLVGYGFSVALNLRQRNRVPRTKMPTTEEAAWPPPPNTGPEPPAV